MKNLETKLKEGNLAVIISVALVVIAILISIIFIVTQNFKPPECNPQFDVPIIVDVKSLLGLPAADVEKILGEPTGKYENPFLKFKSEQDQLKEYYESKNIEVIEIHYGVEYHNYRFGSYDIAVWYDEDNISEWFILGPRIDLDFFFQLEFLGNGLPREDYEIDAYDEILHLFGFYCVPPPVEGYNLSGHFGSELQYSGMVYEWENLDGYAVTLAFLDFTDQSEISVSIRKINDE
jgi:hypothetical protein